MVSPIYFGKMHFLQPQLDSWNAGALESLCHLSKLKNVVLKTTMSPRRKSHSATAVIDKQSLQEKTLQTIKQTILNKDTDRQTIH